MSFIRNSSFTLDLFKEYMQCVKSCRQLQVFQLFLDNTKADDDFWYGQEEGLNNVIKKSIQQSEIDKIMQETLSPGKPPKGDAL